MKKYYLLIIACFCCISVHAAYLKNVPKTLTQPDGSVLHCYASGDEFYNYLHDKNGFTIIQDPITGFFVYADKQDGRLVATEFVAGSVDPASKNLRPFNLISPEEWTTRRNAWQEKEKCPINRDGLPNHGTLNNISIFIRFSDDEEFVNTYSSIDNMFNDESQNAVSMKTYFRAASYGAIEIPTYFYPGHNGETIISYQDSYPRSYFQPYNAATNPNGYQEDEVANREFSLLERAVNYINTNYPIPTDLNIDYDNDGLVDNVCFIVRGTPGDWASLLWPHKWSLYDREVLINGKRVWTFNFQLADATGYFTTSVMCHEMNHSLGAPDLYHYSYSGPDAVGIWDLMHNNTMPPQHCGAYMKMKYGHWIDEIPEITQSGTYTLNPISSPTPTNIAYKIKTEDPDQFYVLEYRDNTSLFETGLPGSGLLVYRIDTRFSGNADYNPNNGIYDEVYIFRPGGSTSANGNLSSAYFSSNAGRTEFSSSTSAYPFFTDGTIDENFRIFNITSAGSTISFTYGNSADCDPPTNLVASVEDHDVLLTWDAVSNAVSYNIYRNGKLIRNTSETTYLDTNVSYGTFSYYLKSVDENGLFSTASETVSVNIELEGAVVIGDGGSATNDYLPSYSYYNYALSQQIYTADEIGTDGTINSISFYNGGAEKTRSFDIYLTETEKAAFDNANDWIRAKEEYLVFSGEVIMLEDNWTSIFFDTPFEYNGTSNLAVIIDDNTGNWTNSPHMSCRVYNADGNQAIRIYNDNINFDPMAPESYDGTVMNVKNQLLLTIEQTPQIFYNITVGAVPVEGGTITIDGNSDTNKLFYNFEDGTSQGWTTLQGPNGDSPDNWMHCVDYTTNDFSTGHGHNASNGFMISESYVQNTTPVHPDNYLVSPQIFLGGSINFWATNLDNEYGAEHFAVAVSTDGNTDVDDFTTVLEWTLPTERTGGTRAMDDGVWYEYFVDLSAFSGLGYVAIHHFDCYEQWLLCVDDITITEGLSGTYEEGTTCTLTAIPNIGYTFVNWTEDDEIISTEDTYSFIVNKDATLVANFTLNSYEVIATTIPVEGGTITIEDISNINEFFYDFEDGTSQGWTFLQGPNGDSPDNWMYCADYTTNDFSTGYGHNASNGFMISESYVQNTTPVHPDNYLVSPQIVLGGSINFWATNLDNEYGAEHFSVAVSTNGNTDVDDFTTVLEWTLPTGRTGDTRAMDDGVWYEYTVDLSAFSGLGYVAIHHFDCYEQWLLCVDDITITEGLTGIYSNTYYHGEFCTLTATANEGYSFVNWTEDDEIVSTEAIYSFEVTSERNLIANFTLNSYEVIVTTIPIEGGTITIDGNSSINEFFYDFEDGTSQGWTFLQGPNSDSPDNWMHCVNYTANDFSTGYGHNASNGFMISESYVQNTTPVHPDNYLVSPHIQLGGSINFWVTNLDNEYGAEHFAVAVSTNGNTDVDDFTTVQEWTLPTGRTGGTRAMDDGVWYEYTVDLSAFSGLGYVAIHHFDCYEQWLLCVDDITIVEGLTGIYSNTYYHGESCTLTATANEGYSFVNWTENDEIVSTEATYSFEVTNERNLIANFEVLVPTIEQTFALSAGWNWISTNVEITLDDLKEALVDALPESTSIQIKSKNTSTSYNGVRWRGTLNELDVTQMYKIKTSASCEITLTGSPINPAEHPVTISNGANWIGFPLTVNMSLADAFAGFAANGDIVRSKDTNSNYNGTRWRGLLNTLEPGQGYIYKSVTSDDSVFTFPVNAE